jgi:hypothetical protein
MPSERQTHLYIYQSSIWQSSKMMLLGIGGMLDPTGNKGWKKRWTPLELPWNRAGAVWLKTRSEKAEQCAAVRMKPRKGDPLSNRKTPGVKVAQGVEHSKAS